MDRTYKPEEIKAMNYIFGKDKDNKYFTEFESQAISHIDLLDKKLVGLCKIIWENRNNKKKLESFMKQLTGGAC